MSRAEKVLHKRGRRGAGGVNSFTFRPETEMRATFSQRRVWVGEHPTPTRDFCHVRRTSSATSSPQSWNTKPRSETECHILLWHISREPEFLTLGHITWSQDSSFFVRQQHQQCLFDTASSTRSRIRHVIHHPLLIDWLLACRPVIALRSSSPVDGTARSGQDTISARSHPNPGAGCLPSYVLCCRYSLREPALNPPLDRHICPSAT